MQAKAEFSLAEDIVPDILKVGLVGYGKMGKAVQEEVFARAGCEIVGIHEQASKDAPFVKTIDDVFAHKGVDLVIDFSHASAFSKVLSCAVASGKPLVSGTTGLSQEDMKNLDIASQKIPVLHATNMSLSLVVTRHAIRQTAALFAGRGYDCHIHEVHHKMKKDMPSGTAKTLGEDVMNGSGGLIVPTYSSARGGTVVGFHEVSFFGPSQSMTFQHNVESRQVFASGALDAALWLVGRPNGLYTMNHVVGLGKV